MWRLSTTRFPTRGLMPLAIGIVGVNEIHTQGVDVAFFGSRTVGLGGRNAATGDASYSPAQRRF